MLQTDDFDYRGFGHRLRVVTRLALGITEAEAATVAGRSELSAPIFCSCPRWFPKSLRVQLASPVASVLGDLPPAPLQRSCSTARFLLAVSAGRFPDAPSCL